MKNVKPKSNIAIIIALILFFPLGIYWMWKESNWKKPVKIVITGFFAICVIAMIVPDPESIDVSTTSIITESVAAIESTTELKVTEVVTDATRETTIAETTTKINNTKSTTTKDSTTKSSTTKPSTTKSSTTKPTTSKQSTTKPSVSKPKPTQSTTKKPTVPKSQPQVNSSGSYILNTNSGKFHRPSCSMVKRMNSSNKQSVTYSYDTMISKGYSPCKVCFK